jgi:hypothetical protein
MTHKINMLKTTSPLIILLALTVVFASCNRAKQKAKEVVNKTGEAVGTGASEFAKGVARGVEETLECTVEISKPQADKGLQAGKFKITDSQDAHDNVLTVYLVFNKDYKGPVAAKIFDRNGQEYGRSAIDVESKAGEAKYYDFTFDKRTDIENKSKFVIE